MRALSIALIRPPVVVLTEGLSHIGPTPPVGLAYVAAALRGAGHRITVIDAPGLALERIEHFDVAAGRVRRIGLSPREVAERIAPETDIVGITNMFAHEWPTVREIAELARRRVPDARVIVGGENATSFWPWMFEQTDAIDVAVLGEGERTIVAVADRVADGTSLHGLAGVALPEVAEASEEPCLPTRIRDVESIDRPAWDLFPMDAYFRYRSFLGVDRGRSMPILATRGCPYECSFCSAPNMWTTRYRVREPVEIVDEIQSYVESYGIENVDFVDLTPITKRRWILEFCDEMVHRGLEVSLQLPIGTRSEALNEEVLRRLYQAGCRNITFAPETGSERMMKIYNKRADLEDILEGIRSARAAGLVTNIHMMIGHPEETWKDRWDNIIFMLRAAGAGLHVAGTTLFYPYPGSADFHALVESGDLIVDDTYCYDCLTRGGRSVNGWNPSASPRTLHALQLAMVGSFAAVSHALHPWQLWHLAKTVLVGGHERTFIEQGINTWRRGPLSKNLKGLRDPEEDRRLPLEVAPAAVLQRPG